MNELQVFNNEKFGELRTIEENGNVLFCGKDVAAALGYADTVNAIKQHCRGVVKRHLTDSIGRQQEAAFVPEGDVYRLIVRSKLPSAQQFERWVFEEVLPSIRKHGAYMTPQKIEEILSDPDTIIQLATQLKHEREQRQQVEAQNTVMLPKAEYYDNFMNQRNLRSLRVTAKLLRVPEKAFIAFLLADRFLYRDQKGKLRPYAAKNKGYFEVKEYLNETTGATGVQTLVTVQGRAYFRKVFDVTVA